MFAFLSSSIIVNYLDTLYYVKNIFFLILKTFYVTQLANALNFIDYFENSKSRYKF